ncbi:MAG: hypothetical protein HYW57_08170 [Ignavibacteriales bacterium]|nr:hypothetical protein [Ignavibacteriales bacterium]
MMTFSEIPSIRRLCFALLYVVSGIGVFAQRYPDRHMTLNPLADQSVPARGGTSWMHSSGGWAEFGAYRLVRDQEHAWIQRLGGYLEMFRIDDEASLTVVGNIEFIANPHNNIRFNPRAVFWEEGFVYTSRAGKNYWQIGYFHRCKHDVDNLLLGTERSLIFGSLQGKYLLPFVMQGGRTEGLLSFRTDLLTIRQDDRTPLTTDRLNLNRALGSFAGMIHLRKQLEQSVVGFYTTAWSGLSVYSRKDGIFNRFSSVESATLSGGLSSGVAIHGNAHFRIGLSYEYISDTGINPVPEHAHLLSLGVVILNPASMW